MEVRFYPLDAEKELKYVVIGAKSGSEWVWCRHRERMTWELPGGHIESGEDPLDAAARELREETGAAEFVIEPACVYAVDRDGTETCGMLLRAEVTSFGPLEFEIVEIRISSDAPGAWTYPAIQPHLLKKLAD